MILDLTAEQRRVQGRSIERFAREVVAPRAAAIDETGEFPARRDPRRGGARAARRDDSDRVGRRRPRLRQLRARHRGDRAGERDGGRVARRSPTRSSPSSSRTPGTDAAEASGGCGRWRAARRSAPSRCRSPRRAPTPRISRPRATPAGDGYRITGRKVWVANADAAGVIDRVCVARSRDGGGRA